MFGNVESFPEKRATHDVNEYYFISKTTSYMGIKSRPVSRKNNDPSGKVVSLFQNTLSNNR